MVPGALKFPEVLRTRPGRWELGSLDGRFHFYPSYTLNFLIKFYLKQVLIFFKRLKIYFKSLSIEFLTTEMQGSKHVPGMQQACLTAVVRGSFRKGVNGKPMLCIGVHGTHVLEHRTQMALKPGISQTTEA